MPPTIMHQVYIIEVNEVKAMVPLPFQVQQTLHELASMATRHRLDDLTLTMVAHRL